MSGQSVADKIDELLKDDNNFTTRSGLRFTIEVLKAAIDVNEKAMAQIQQFQDHQERIEDRLEHVEKWQEDFSTARAEEKKKDEAERTKWRWAFLGPSIALVVGEIGYVMVWLVKTLIAVAGHATP